MHTSDGVNTLNLIDKYFHMNEGSIGDPDMYLGAKLCRTVLTNGVEEWATNLRKYVQNPMKNVDGHLYKENDSKKLANHTNTPFMRAWLQA